MSQPFLQNMPYLVYRWFLVLLLSWLVQSVQAQNQDTYRLEIGGGLGTSFYLGDVNSRLYALNSVSVAAQLRFIIHSRAALKVELSRVGLKGNTAKVKSFFPANVQSGAVSTIPLHYDFSSAAYSLATLYELHFLPYGYYRSYQGLSRLVPYLQGGLALNYGVQDKVFFPSIPLGVGLKYKVSPRLNLGFDWLVHFTTSDRLDGLNGPHGVSSQGFKNKDHYITTRFTLTYDIAPHCSTCNKDNR